MKLHRSEGKGTAAAAAAGGRDVDDTDHPNGPPHTAATTPPSPPPPAEDPVLTEFRRALSKYRNDDDVPGVRRWRASMFRFRTEDTIRNASFTQAELASSWRLVRAATRVFDKSVGSIVDAVNRDISPDTQVTADELEELRAAAITTIARCAADAFGLTPLAPARVFGQAFDDGELPFEGNRAACWHCHAIVDDVHCSAVWHTGRQENFHDEFRQPFGTLVTGPAGSGKTVFMAYTVAAVLPCHSVRDPWPPRKTKLTALMKLASILSKYEVRWDAGCETDAARAKRARELLPGAVVAELRRLLQPYRLAKDTYVVACIDEVEAVPEVMAEELVWYDIAREVVQHATFDGDVMGVHVVAAGVGAQGPADYYRAFLPMRKVRLRPWGEAEVLRMIKDNDAGGPGLEECVKLLYSSQQHPLLTAMTNPRMACGVVQRLYEASTSPAKAGSAADGAGWPERVRGMRGELLKAAVCAHVERSALQPLVAGADSTAPSTTKELRGSVVRGVGVGALRAVMNQNAYDALNLQPLTDPTDVACARAAEAFGLIECNIEVDGSVGRVGNRGRLAYGISDAMVLVALHLSGVDVSELPSAASSPSASEEGLPALTALAEKATAAGEHHLDTVSASELMLPSAALPAALNGCRLPVVRERASPLPEVDGGAAGPDLGPNAGIGEGGTEGGGA